MYTNFDLFTMASKFQKEEQFLLSITSSGNDIDNQAEKKRLNDIWKASQMSIRDMVASTGSTQESFGREVGIPRRTIQNWCTGQRSCPEYVRFLLAEHYDLFNR